jgi:hypothetical protein
MSPELDYQALHQQVATELKQRKFRTRLIFFITTLIIYVLFLLMAGVMVNQGHFAVQLAAGGTPPGLLNALSNITGALFLLGAVGFIGLLFQGISLYLDTRTGENRLRERLLARAIAREMRHRDIGDYEQKAKRKRTPLLTDDDRLEAMSEALWDDSAPARRNGRSD